MEGDEAVDGGDPGGGTSDYEPSVSESLQPSVDARMNP